MLRKEVFIDLCPECALLEESGQPDGFFGRLKYSSFNLFHDLQMVDTSNIVQA